jgi:hypothetical protein
MQAKAHSLRPAKASSSHCPESDAQPQAGLGSRALTYLHRQPTLYSGVSGNLGGHAPASPKQTIARPNRNNTLRQHPKPPQMDLTRSPYSSLCDVCQSLFATEGTFEKLRSYPGIKIKRQISALKAAACNGCRFCELILASPDRYAITNKYHAVRPLLTLPADEKDVVWEFGFRTVTDTKDDGTVLPASLLHWTMTPAWLPDNVMSADEEWKYKRDHELRFKFYMGTEHST